MIWFPKAKHLDRAMWNWLLWQRIVAAIAGCRGGLLGPYYAELYSWCTVRPYSKMVIFKLCNLSLWIGNNYYKTAAELYYITFWRIILWFLAPVPLWLDKLVFLPREKCKFEENLFSVNKILICEKSKWSSPSLIRIFKIYTQFHIIWCITLNQI